MRGVAVLIVALALATMPAVAQAKTKGTVVQDAPSVEMDAPPPEVETETPAADPGTPASEDATPADGPVVTSGEPVSVQVFKTCLDYAKGDVLAGETAKQQGWEAYDDGGESPYVKSYSGTKSFPDVGDAALFSLVESYPDTTFGYCRIDIQSPVGEADVNALRDLPELAGGQVITNGDGTFGSWKGAVAEPQLLLLSHQTTDAYVLQLTVITSRDGPAVAK